MSDVACSQLVGMGLAKDSAGSTVGPEAFAALGITPRSVRSYLQQRAAAARGAELMQAPAH